MMKTLLSSLICGIILQGCASLVTETVIPDQTIAHRIAQPIKVTVWLRQGDSDTFQEVEVQFLPGWWIAPPSWGDAAAPAGPSRPKPRP